jgi:hypothetical protein
MSKSHKTWPFSVIVGLIITSAANAQNTVIDFETVPGFYGTPPPEGLEIDNQFQSSHGVRFDLLNVNNFEPLGESPLLSVVAGDDYFAFQGPNRTSRCAPNQPTRHDMPAANQNVGCRFLTDDGVVARADKALRVRYDSGVSAASGTILDIDGEEVWRVSAYGVLNPTSSTPELGFVRLCSDSYSGATTDCTMAAAGDGLATSFVVNGGGQQIRSLVIRYDSEQRNRNVGLAFDNFRPDADAPPPIQPCCAPWDNARLNESITGEIPGAGNTYPLYWTTLPQVDQQMQAHVDYANLLNPGITHVDLTLWVMDCSVNQFAGDPPCAMLNNVVELYTVRWSAGGSAPEYFHQSTPGGLSFSSGFPGVGAQLSGSQDVFSHIAFRENNYYAIYGMVWTNLDPSPIANFGDGHSLGGCEATLWRINLQEQFMRQARDRAGSARRGAAIPLPRAAIIVGEETVSRERVREPIRGIPRRPQERPGREGQRRQPQ